MVKELHDIATSLLEEDGAYRDLNFEAPTWAGVGNLLDTLEIDYAEVSGTDGDGRVLARPFRASILPLTQKHRSAHLLFNAGVGLIKNLQVFVCTEDDGSPFVEVTFVPDDVEVSASLRNDFLKWAEGMRILLGAQRYFARNANASWRFGDTGARSGVFLVSGQTPCDVPRCLWALGSVVGLVAGAVLAVQAVMFQIDLSETFEHANPREEAYLFGTPVAFVLVVLSWTVLRHGFSITTVSKGLIYGSPAVAFVLILHAIRAALVNTDGTFMAIHFFAPLLGLVALVAYVIVVWRFGAPRSRRCPQMRSR